MADAQLSTSITSISERASEVAVSASADELQKISRVAPSLEQSENAALEVAINTRAAAIAGTASAADLKKIGKAIGNMLEPQTTSVSGEFIGSQTNHAGKFFSTNGTARNWGGVTMGGLQQVQLSTIENDQTLVYNSVSGKFENSSRAFDIPQYSLTQNLPASANAGEVVFDVQSSQLKYWDGAEWKVAAVVAAAAGGGSASVDWSGSVFADNFHSVTGINAIPTPAVCGNIVVVRDGYTDNFYAYDRDSGAQQWSIPQDGYMSSDIGGSDTIFVIGKSPNWATAGVKVYNPADGSLYGTLLDHQGNNFPGENIKVYGNTVLSHSQTGITTGDAGVAKLFSITSLDPFQYTSLDLQYPFNPNGVHFGIDAALGETVAAVSTYSGGADEILLFDHNGNNLSRLISPERNSGGESWGRAEQYSHAGAMAISGTNLYVGDCKYGGSDNGKLYKYDITDPSNPSLTTSFEPSDFGLTNVNKFAKTVVSAGKYLSVGYMSTAHSTSNLAFLLIDTDTDTVVQSIDGSSNTYGNHGHRFISMGDDGTNATIAISAYNDGGLLIWRNNSAFVSASSSSGESSESSAVSGKIVVGAKSDADNGSHSGSVYVYDLDGTNEVKITASDGNAGDKFGSSVAIGDNKIVVGARNDSDNGIEFGSVYVYDLDGTNEVKITASDGREMDRFGEKVAIGDNKIVVSAMYDDQFDSNTAAGQTQFGSVYVYDIDGTNEVRITASDGAQSDYFGSSVAVGSNKIVVGAFENDDNGSNSGSVYVYDLDGTNEVKINASDGSADALFGSSVVVSDSKIYVGAKGDNTKGAVYVYNLDGTGEVKITASDGYQWDYFGHSIAVGDNKIAVGAYLDDDDGNNSGAVYIYDLDGSNEVKITQSNASANDRFGISVSIAGGKVLVGEIGHLDGVDVGAVYVYDLDGTNEVKITASDGESFDYFGESVAIFSEGSSASSSSGESTSTIKSVSFPTTAAHLKLDNMANETPDLDFGTGDFTVEGWWYKTSTDGTLFSGGTLGAYDFSYTGNTFRVGRLNKAWDHIFDHTLTNDQWHHIAFVRYNGTIYVYVNGNSIGEGANSQDYYSGTPVYIGQNLETSRAFSGKMADIRVVKSAVYTANFSAPTEPLQKIANTVLLTARADTIIDESDDANSITSLNSAAVVDESPYSSSSSTPVDWSPLTISTRFEKSVYDLTDTAPELLTNPSFDTDSDWIKTFIGEGYPDLWVISGGQATMPTTNSYRPLYQPNIGMQVGESYTATIVVSAVTGRMKWDLAGVDRGRYIHGNTTQGYGLQIETPGTYTFDFTYTGYDKLGEPVDGIGIARAINGSSCTVDSMSVKLTNAGGTTGESDLAVDMSETHTVIGIDKAYSGYGVIKLIDNSTGVVQWSVNNPNPVTAGSFGRRNSVGTDGTHVVVGNRDQDEVYVYDMSGTLLRTISGPDAGAQFGHSVKIDGDYIAVGGYNQDKAYICSTSTGAVLHTLTNPNVYGSTPDQFGQVVDISGNFMVVSTVEEDAADGSNSGVAYVYTVDAGSLLHTFVNPNAHGTSALDNFGIDCALDGNYLVVGAFGESDAAVGSGSGKAYFYNVATGTLLHTIDNPNPDNGSEVDYMGWSVAVDGQTALVSAWYETGTAGADAGKCYIYDIVSGNLLHTIEDPNFYSAGGTDDRFGSEVAISGNYFAVSAKGEDHASQDNVGALYVFKGE